MATSFFCCSEGYGHGSLLECCSLRRKQELAPRACEEGDADLGRKLAFKLEQYSVGVQPGRRAKTHGERSDSLDHGRVLGRRQGVVGGRENTLRLAAGARGLDVDLLGRHLVAVARRDAVCVFCDDDAIGRKEGGCEKSTGSRRQYAVEFLALRSRGTSPARLRLEELGWAGLHQRHPPSMEALRVAPYCDHDNL